MATTDERARQLVTQAAPASQGRASEAFQSPTSGGPFAHYQLRSSSHLGTESHFAGAVSRDEAERARAHRAVSRHRASHSPDLMIFEHRLRQNVAVLQTTWVRYQLTLILLTCVALYAGYSLLGHADMNLLSYSTHVAIFLLALVGLGTLLGSGLYAERVAQARAFVPRCQRALANFCLGFQPDNGGHLTILARRRLPAKFVTDFHQYRDAIRMRAAGLQTGPLLPAADKQSTATE